MWAMPDISALIKDLGWPIAVIVFLLYYKLKHDYRIIHKWKTDIDSTLRQISDIHRSITDAAGIIHRSKIIESVEDQTGRIEEVITTHCTPHNCPIVPVVKTSFDEMKNSIKTHLEEMRSLLVNFTTEAKDARKETHSLVKDIFDRINSFINELGREIIYVLRDFRRKSNGD